MGQMDKQPNDLNLEKKIDCPKCYTTMQQIMISKPSFIVMVDRCNDCEGYWFDKFELDKVLDEKTKKEGLPFDSSPKDEVGFQCPRCSGDCETKTLYDINIDLCMDCHGIWLDKGELADVQKAYRIEQNQNQLLGLLHEALES
jgi:Zn-finger nucleic acid-binding protein